MVRNKRIERSEIGRDGSSGGLKPLDGGVPVSVSYHFLLLLTENWSAFIRLGYRSWGGLHSAIACGLVARVGWKLEILLAILNDVE